MSQMKICPNGHRYDASLPACPYCPSSDSHNKTLVDETAVGAGVTLVDESSAPNNPDKNNLFIQSGLFIIHEGTRNSVDVLIPFGYPNANADVESFHRLIEEEFYRREPIKSKKEFLSKIFTYLFYFNCIRQNSYRNFKTPLDYIKEKKINPEILILPPVFIDDIIYDDKVGLSILTNIMKKKKKYKKKLTHHVTRIPEIILEENFICLI